MTKLQTLMETEGYEDELEFLQDCTVGKFTPGCPAICKNPDCNYTSTDMEPDQTKGWCPECEANTMVSALILARMV